MNRLLLLPFFFVLACGEDFDLDALRFHALEDAQPLDLALIDRGVGVQSGEAMAIAKYNPTMFPKVTAALSHAVYTVPAYDAPTQELGEFVTFPPPNGVDERSSVLFKVTSPEAGKFAARVGDEYGDTETFGGESSASFTSESVVLDFWRLSGDWYVRWDGKLDDPANREGRGQYGFYRIDFSEDLLDQIERVAQTHQPRYFIIGNEMERLLATSEGAGIAPNEFSNFFAFYQEAVARIHAASPSTKVGFGIDWDRFYTRVSLGYAADDVERDVAVDIALQTTLIPLWKDSDIIALSLYQAPGVDAGRYQFLRRLPELYEIDLPIVYHSVGSPVTSSVNYLDQKNFLEEFGQRNAGLNVEFMAWRRVLNFEGTDTNNQVIGGRCLAMTEESRGLKMPLSGCYDGLFTSIFSAKETFDVFDALK